MWWSESYTQFDWSLTMIYCRTDAWITLPSTSYCFSCYHVKQMESMLPWVCTVTGHRRRQFLVITSLTHSARLVFPFFVLAAFWAVIYHLKDVWQNGLYLLNRAWRHCSSHCVPAFWPQHPGYRPWASSKKNELPCEPKLFSYRPS